MGFYSFVKLGDLGAKIDQKVSLQIPPFRKLWTFSRGGGDLYKVSIRAAPAAGFLRRWILRSILLYRVWTLLKITNCNLKKRFPNPAFRGGMNVFMNNNGLVSCMTIILLPM